MTQFLNRLGDRVNPIVVKEMRQAVNSRFVAGMLVLFLGIELIMMMLYLVTGMESQSDALNMRMGREIFAWTQGILVVSCMLLIPILTGGRLALERSDVNVDLLFISSLSPRAIMMGKCCAAAALALLIFSACAPFMTFAYLLRGLDIPTIVVVLTADFLAVLFGTMFALLIASIPAPLGLRILLALFTIVALGIMTVWVVGLTSAGLVFEIQSERNSWEFWLGYAGIASAILGTIGLMFFWATALISPPASNRVFLVRLYTTGFWAIGMIWGAIWSTIEEREAPMAVCGLLGCFLWCLQLVIASSERDRWGPRVLRRIPRSPVLRVPAFLSYSGAAGGFLFGVLGSIANVAAVYLWRVLHPSYSGRSSDEGLLTISALLPPYVYCYCMMAVMVRRLLRHTIFKASLTWLLAAIIFGLCCIVPFIMHAALFSRRYGGAFDPDTMWVYLPSGPVMIGEAIDRSGSNHLEFTIPFLVLSAIAVTAINGLWLVDQIVHFKPPSEKSTEPDADDGGVDYVIRKREARKKRPERERERDEDRDDG